MIEIIKDCTARNFLLFLALVFGFTSSVFGAITVANAAAIVEEAENSLTLEENRSIVLRLDRKASNVFVVNPDIADIQLKSPSVLYLFGNRPGITSFYALDANDNVIYSATITVEYNLERMQKMIDDLVPNASIKLQVLNDIVILTGFAKTPEEVDLAVQVVQRITSSRRSSGGLFGGGGNSNLDLINQVKIQTPTQVNLRVKIAEMGRDIMKTLGFNWEASFLTAGGGSIFGFTQGNQVFSLIEDPQNEGTFIKNFFVGNNDTNSLFWDNVGGRHDVSSVIDALEDEGFLSVLAEPNLTALSGETASFLAGGEFPIPVPQNGTASNGITVTFKQFGVGLNFTPTVLSENKINLKVAPEVSQLSSAGAVTVEGISIPALTTRRVNTTVELGSGQSFAIAGLLQSNITQEVSKYPFLGDIPIIGTLFRSDSFRREETELVIIVTPYIVEPAYQGELLSIEQMNTLPQDTGRWIKGKRDLAGDGGLSTGEGG